jgi:hypothetical protein
MATIYNRDDRELKFHGVATVEPGDDLILWFDGYPGAVQVHIGGTGSAAYMVSTTVAPSEMIVADTAQYIDAESSDIDEDQDFNLDYGVSAVKVTNQATSTDDIDVAWRVVKI